jgi:hypothetical protein
MHCTALRLLLASSDLSLGYPSRDLHLHLREQQREDLLREESFVSVSSVDAEKGSSRRGFFVAGISEACSGDIRISTLAARSQGRVRFAAMRRTANARLRFGVFLTFSVGVEISASSVGSCIKNICDGIEAALVFLKLLFIHSFIRTYFLFLYASSLLYNILTLVQECDMPITCNKGGTFSVKNPALRSAVESWTALMHTLGSAKPEWWTNVNVDVDMRDYSNGTSMDTGTGMDALGAGVPVATSRQGDESENIVALQAMDCPSTPYTAEDETVYATAESRPLSDDDKDDGL